MKNVYHLDLNKSKIQGAKVALLPGDPFRVPRIAEFISQRYQTPRKEIAHKREYRSFLTGIKGEKILITSTGIGGPSTSIAVEELARLGIRTFLRVGTTGAIQDYIELGDLIITSASVRLDGASRHYAPLAYPASAHYEVINALVKAARKEKIKYHVGITASCDTFYPGQERYDTVSGYVLRRFQGITDEWKRLKVLNYEMESATLLTICSTLGFRAGSVTGVINRRRNEEVISPSDLKKGEKNAILAAVRALEELD